MHASKLRDDMFPQVYTKQVQSICSIMMCEGSSTKFDCSNANRKWYPLYMYKNLNIY